MKHKEQPKRRTTIGGQALIEGIMMQGPERVATVVRKSDGRHVVQETAVKRHGRLAKIPFLRGVFVFGASIKNGTKQLMFSANEADVPEAEPSKFDQWVEKKIGMEKAEKILTNIAIVLGVLLPVGLFILLPTILSGLVTFPDHLRWLRSLTEGVLRMVIFIGFLFLTSLMKDMRRTYGYHGAEHKTVHCYEAEEELTVENVRRHTRLHPRCGTSFLFVVMIISILVFSFVRVDNAWLRLLLRLALLPVVVNLSYEANRLVGRYDNWLTKALRAPGLALQLLTTKEPDDEMIKVAIDALERVIPAEKGADQW